MTRNPLLRLVFSHLKPYTGQAIAVVLFQFAATIASLYLPRLNADIIDNGVAKGDTGYIWTYGGIMLAVSASQVISQVCAVYFGARLAMGFGRDVRQHIFDRALDFSAQELNRFGAPSLLTRNTNDVQQVQMVVLMTCILILGAPITMVGGVYMALRTNVSLSWLIAAAVGALAVIAAVVLSRMGPLFSAMQTRTDTINRVLREHISGIRVVRAFVREDYEAEGFGQANRELTDTGLKVGRLMMTLFP
ncbi:MAG: ABC transporter ATP-binding protein, partial [Propionibacteriaceae bacterium]|nr:ABC transporter ATP-binding protein [Propionibacteriaceae bacterium]